MLLLLVDDEDERDAVREAVHVCSQNRFLHVGREERNK